MVKGGSSVSVNNVPIGMGEVPKDTNALTVYAKDKSGAWLPALTARVDLNDITGDNWDLPLELAVRGDVYKLPE